MLIREHIAARFAIDIVIPFQVTNVFGRQTEADGSAVQSVGVAVTRRSARFRMSRVMHDRLAAASRITSHEPRPPTCRPGFTDQWVTDARRREAHGLLSTSRRPPQAYTRRARQEPRRMVLPNNALKLTRAASVTLPRPSQLNAVLDGQRRSGGW
jgi:hypothetical protein